MKNKKLIGLSTLLLLSLNLISQNLTQTVKGKIIDKDSRMTIIGANIIILQSDPLIGSSTDINGYFQIKDVSVGRVNLQVTALGYETQVLSNIIVESGKETNLNIELIESYEKLKEVVITGEDGQAINEMAIVSSKTLTTEATARYAGSLNDPARMVSAFAGVVSNPAGDNDIVVRGNSPRGVLWRLEGVEIPNPNHFASEGTTGGPVNTLNGSMLSNSDFFSGAFAPEYGNAISGVFDSRFRTGNHDKREYSFSLGVLGTDVTLEGPFSKNYNGSYLVNFRYSTLDLLDKTGIIDFGGIPKYYDGSFKLNLPTVNKGTFVAFGLLGQSSIAQEFGEGDEDEKITYKSDFGAGLSVFGLKHFYNLKNQSYIKSYITFSNNFNGEHSNLLNDTINKFYENYRDKFNENKVRISTSYNAKLNSKNTVNIGGIYTHSFFNMVATSTESNAQSETLIDEKGNNGLIQFYSSWKYRLKKNITLVSGLHYTQLLLNNNNALEPRISMKWNLNERQYFTVGTGLHSRVENSSVYLANTSDNINEKATANENLGLTKSAHFVVGFGQQINERSILKTEVYYQHLFNVPISGNLNSKFSLLNESGGYVNSPLISEGTGRNYGIELSLERSFSKGFYYLLTGSLYESKYTPKNGIEYNTRFNANYAGNLLVGKEFKLRSKNNNKTLAVNIKTSLLGGNRYTPIDLESSIAADKQVLFEERAFESKLDDVFFLNVGVTYRVNRKKTTHEFKVDIQNITNNQAAVGVYYDRSDKRIESFNQLSILPNILYIVKF